MLRILPAQQTASCHITGKDNRKSYYKFIKTTFSPEKVTAQTACKSGIRNL